jgi:hypothetical protein
MLTKDDCPDWEQEFETMIKIFLLLALVFLPFLLRSGY